MSERRVWRGWLAFALAGSLVASTVAFLLLGSAPTVGGCGGDRGETEAEGLECPPRAEAPPLLPGTHPSEETVDHWVHILEKRHDLDEAVMTPERIAALNTSLRERGLGGARSQLDGPISPRFVESVDRRLRWLHRKAARAKYLEANGKPLSPGALARLRPLRRPPPLVSRVHVALERIPIRCGPIRRGLFKPDLDARFDQNSCSTLRAQEPVQVLADWPGDMKLVRTRYTFGWISATARLSPPLSRLQRERWLRGGLYRTLEPKTLTSPTSVSVSLPAFTRLPSADRGWVRFATGTGFHSAPAVGWEATRRALTRRRLIEEAFSYLGTPYGWGGQDGGLDCSRLMMEVFSGFGLELPRTSGGQAEAGTFSIDLTVVPREEMRVHLIDVAADHGIVLLHLPGHIMLYLGRNRDGEPMVLHSLAEYVSPCKGGDNSPGRNERETLFQVRTAHVSDLELGRGGSREALIERLDRIVVIGSPPRPGLGSIARMRPPTPVGAVRRCPNDLDTPIWITPASPNMRQPLKVIVSTSENPGPAELALFRSGRRTGEPKRASFAVDKMGGPPFGRVARVEGPKPGWWTAVFGDGSRIYGCRRFLVRRRPKRGRPPETQAAPGAAGGEQDGDDEPVLAWTVRNRWNEQTENLYSTWVESLFSYGWRNPPTWPNLSELLRDSHRNLLHDHFRRGEDDALYMRPDCADLPYFLRAYFAWRLGLPFGFRSCTRAHPRRPIRCKKLNGHYTPERAETPTKTFRSFVRHVKGNVHSSCPRTPPAHSRTDFYPIPLRRSSLRPGAVYADPYGHTLVLTRWVDQTPSRPGVLVAADAQPDGTVGLRRFWEGSFLFSTETKRLGAGWKAFRPVRYLRRRKRFYAPGNSRLSDRFLPFSTEQYRSTVESFYDEMSRLIHPLPLDAGQRLAALVDALHGLVQRRVVAVRKGEQHVAEARAEGRAEGRAAGRRARPDRQGELPVSMPWGGDIFQTSGPWEQFATPARDLRLLIAIDVVERFPEKVAGTPERFGVQPEEAAKLSAELRDELDRMLGERTIAYERSDGSKKTLTLSQVARRKKRLEMAYNPNDCPEIRWGAPPGSDELSTCGRRAPPRQRKRMQRYRRWFSTRTRPSR